MTFRKSDSWELFSFRDGVEQASKSAQMWLDWLKAAPMGATVALSGGRNAQDFFDQVVRQSRNAPELLSKARYFWGDERCVPVSSLESNYGMARRHFLDPAGVDPSRIHRIRGELTPSEATAEANAAAQQWAGKGKDSFPIFDLVLLGMGEDGHIASLFPNAPHGVVCCASAYVWVDSSPKQPPNRISLTYGALGAAREVWVLASGTAKKEALEKSIGAEGGTPLAKILRQRPMTRVFCDSII